MYIRYLIQRLVVCAVLLVYSSVAMASYPDRPITLVVTYSAGGEADVQMRIVARYLEKEFGVPFVVRNVVGAGGQIGWDKVALGSADGYTWVNYNLPQVVVQPLVRHTNYTVDSFEPLILFRDDPSVLAVRKDNPSTLETLVDKARKEPGKVPIAVTGKWTQHDLTFQFLEDAAKVKFVEINVDGQAEVNLLLLGDQVPTGFGNSSAFYRMRNQYRVIAVAAKKRIGTLPDAPTFEEAGFPGVISSVIMGLAVAKGTNPEIIKQVSDRLYHMFETNEALRNDLEKAGAPPVVLSRDEAIQLIAERRDTISKSLKAHGIKTQ